MEALRLFDLRPQHGVVTMARELSASPRESGDTAWHEVELFLADRLERDGDLAQIQAALALCEAAGGGRDVLEALVLDPYRFPRAAHAIERVRQLLELAPAERPDGFWPRFLLDQFDGPEQT